MADLRDQARSPSSSSPPAWPASSRCSPWWRIHYGTDAFWGQVFPGQALRIAALLALASATYCALFGAVSLLLKRSMIIGVAYIILFEGIFANIDFVVRKATVMYYTRVLAERWLGLHVDSWSIDLDDAPSGWNCLLILLGAILVSTVAAAIALHRPRVPTQDAGRELDSNRILRRSEPPRDGTRPMRT